jgi:hypothetical protein
MSIKLSSVGLLTTVMLLILFFIKATYYFNHEDNSSLQYGSLDQYFSSGVFWGVGWMLFLLPLAFFTSELLKSVFDGKDEK